MISVSEQLILIRRGIHQIVPEDELAKKLERSVKTGKPLRVKYGIDPTGIDVHLGHTVPLRKLRLFQELGHQAVLIIGNYTALVGDPSGRDQTRARLTQEQVEANARDYLKQVSKVIDIAKTEVTHNGDWFSKFRFLDVLDLTSKITVQRMLERDDFTKRRAGRHADLPARMPLSADAGPGQRRDQGRRRTGRQRAALQPDGRPRLASRCRPGAADLPDAADPARPRRRAPHGQEPGQLHRRRPSKPQEQFDKTMSIPDALMPEWFTLLTDRSAAEIEALTDATNGNPRDAKLTLGKDIVAYYYGAEAAETAAAEWLKRFSRREDPTDIPDFSVPANELVDDEIPVAKLIVLLSWAKSNNEARRAIEGGGVNVGPDKVKIEDPKARIKIADGLIVRLGSRKIARVRST